MKVILRTGAGAVGADDVGWGPEAASQTFPIGALLIRSGGKLAVAAETAQNVNGSQVMVGFANHAASGTTDAEVRFARIRGGKRYEMQVVNGSDTILAANAAAVGNSYGLRRIARTIGDRTVYGYVVDISDITAPYVKVVGTALLPGENAATAGTSVYVEWVGGTFEG